MVPERLSHVRQQKLRQPSGAEQVHFELVARLVDTDVLNGTVQPEPRVVHQHIHAIDFVEDGLNGRCDVGVP